MNAVHEYLDALSELLLPGTPVYIVLQSDGPPAELRVPGASGFTGGLCDASFRPWLESRGLWQGRRALFFVDDSGLANESEPNATDWAGRAWRADMWHSVAAIAVHELGHIADIPRDDRPLSPHVVRDASESLELSAIDAERPRPRADYHGPRWLRIVAHLLHRARKAWHGIDSDKVGGGTYGSPPVTSAMITLEDEFAKMADVPVAQINDSPPPADFVDMWQFSLSRWRDKQPAVDADADKLVSRAKSELAGIGIGIGHTTAPAPGNLIETPCIAASTLEK